MIKLFVPAVLLLLSLGSAAAAEQVSPAPAAADAEILQWLKLRVDKQYQATGVVVGIVDPSGERIVTYGRLGLSDTRAMNADTVFDVGSITKIVTSLVLADMAAHGEISLDDPVMKYLPAASVTMPKYDGREITFADLATHTSGLPLRPANLRSTDPDNKYAGYSLDDLYAFLSNYKLPYAPGSRYEYSNVGYGLIGAALSRRAGASWAELVRTRITSVLGMSDTRADLTGDMKHRMATGYALDLASLTLTPAKHWDMGALESAGALRSTPHDLMKLLAAALDLKPSPLKQAFDLTLSTRRPGGMQPATEIALGWNILRTDAREIAWKNGNVGGFRTFVGLDRSARRGVVALANAQTGNGVDDIGLHLLDPSIPVDMHVPRPHKEIALAPAVLDRYVGRYRFSETDTITIERDGDHLVCLLGPDKLPLFAEGERDFFLKVADIQLTFEAIVAGRPTKVIWHQGGEDQVGVRID
ncbi:MAG: serine hydrolase [Alphaproteobacteria bacterium]|nr:serine hydrolase [Alphaproteobacteria bacterium]